MNIIDIHVHPELEDQDYSLTEKMIGLAKRYGVKHICLLGDVLHFGYDPSEEQIRKINDQTIELVEKWSDFFFGFCFLNPKHPEEFMQQEAGRCFKNKNFKGIKLEVAVNARNKHVEKVMRIARNMNIVVLLHSWSTEIIDNREHQSDPEDIAYLASHFPDVKIIMAHVTSARERGVLAIKPFSNVWVDTSGGQPIAGTIEYAVEKLGSERILFGSDAPGRDFSAQLGKIYGSNISEYAKRSILGENARKLLGITDG
ncbi:MAG: amidohydrolase family protein [Dictyoglomi bacterium]|jgi:hypothetical protein|nr:amidohydrolase family protein [Dictyoglomota bacterium]HHV81646.1 amidohydrolase family protein [bacterium]HOK30182.1 amidohydrolase family protein [bacterium]